MQAMGHCIGGLSLFMAHGRRAWRACARRRSPASPATRSRRRATRRGRGRGWRRSSRRSGSSASTSSTTRSAGTARLVETLMRLVPFRHIYDNPVARRIYFIYGDVYDYENINRATMEQAVPGFFGGGNMTFFEHISLMIRASEARDARGQRRLLGEPRRTSSSRSTSSPASTTGCSSRRACSARYDTLRKAHGPPNYTQHVIKRLRAPRSVAGHERRARRVADRPCRAGEAQLDERH